MIDIDRIFSGEIEVESLYTDHGTCDGCIFRNYKESECYAMDSDVEDAQINKSFDCGSNLIWVLK